MSEEPLGRTGVAITTELRQRVIWQLMHGGEAPPEPPASLPLDAGESPESAPPQPVAVTPLEALAIFAQKPPTFPPGQPSLPSRPYQYGDDVAINEVVLGNDATGEMVVVYPGSQEAAAHPWPTWLQVYVG